MLRQSKHWLLCGALALPIGFGIGYALDARIPEAKARSYEAPLSALPSAPVRVAEKPPVGERITAKEPERATPPPAPPREKIATKTPERTPPPPPAATPPAPEKPAPVTADPPAKNPLSGLKVPRFDKGGISFDDDEVKIRTPYGSFSFGF